MSSSDEEDFRALVGADVKPISVEKRVKLKESKGDAETLAKRREAAEDEKKAPQDPLGGEPVEFVSPMDIISFKRSGVQHGVFKNLRLGKYTIDARLDLHKMNVERARREVYSFIKDCVEHDVRTALITHGKGEGREQPALLKSYIAFWLPQIDEVLAFHTAMKQHGSYGASYVLLRKSDKKKQEAREKIHRKL